MKNKAKNNIDFVNNKYSSKEIRQYIKDNIEKYPTKYNKPYFWLMIVENQRLSPSFIEEFWDKLHIYYLQTKQNIPEYLIDKHKHEVNWFLLSYYQNFSEKFWIENFNNIKFPDFYNNTKVPEKVKKKILDLKKVIDH